MRSLCAPDHIGGIVLDGLAAPAWLVALTTSAFLGARFVLAVRQNGNGKTGEFAGRVITLLENQTHELRALRQIADATKDILQQQNTLLAAHDQRAADAIKRMDERAT